MKISGRIVKPKIKIIGGVIRSLCRFHEAEILNLPRMY